jgi:hypothetical protein
MMPTFYLVFQRFLRSSYAQINKINPKNAKNQVKKKVKKKKKGCYTWNKLVN